MIQVIVLTPLVEELQKGLSEISFTPVIVEASNGKSLHNNDGLILFSQIHGIKVKFLEVHSITGINTKLLLIKLNIQ